MKKGAAGPYELLIKAANQRAAETGLVFEGRRAKRRELAKNGVLLKELLDGKVKDRFVSYGVENGEVLWFWNSKVVPDNFEGKLIQVRPFIISGRMIKAGLIEELAVRARKFHRAPRLKVQFGFLPSEEDKARLCAERGLKASYRLLDAKVADSLKYLNVKKPALPKGYELAELDPEKEMSAFLDVQVRSLKSDRTSSMYLVPAARIRKVFLKFFGAKPEQKTFGIYRLGRLIGAGTFSVSGASPRRGLVGTMTILPGHRGKGLSSVLYRAGLSWLKSRRVGRYRGLTSTERVLCNMDKMKRRVIVSFFKL